MDARIVAESNPNYKGVLQLFCAVLQPEKKKRRFDQSAFVLCNCVCAEFHGVISGIAKKQCHCEPVRRLAWQSPYISEMSEGIAAPACALRRAKSRLRRLRSVRAAAQWFAMTWMIVAYLALGRISSLMTVYSFSSSSSVVSRQREMRKVPSIRSGETFMASSTWLRWPLAQAEPALTQMP